MCASFFTITIIALGKDNLSESLSILTKRQLDKFVRDYRIPIDLNPVLPSKNEIIYPFRQGKFPLYTRVCSFANFRVPFSKFLIRVLLFFRVHLCQVTPFGISRVNHFKISCRALNQKPDLDVFRYFHEFITAGDWYTFAHRKGIPSPSGDERSSLKNWKDNFFWLDDHWLPVEMVWRFKDQTMSFDLGEGFIFNHELARALIDNQSPIRPLPEHLFLLGRVCFSWGRGDRYRPVICTKSERDEMSLRDALKVPNFNVLDFYFDDQVEGEVPFLKQVSLSAQEIRPLIDQGATGPPSTDVVSTFPKPTKENVGLSGSRAKGDSQLEDVDSDPEVRSLDEALKYRPSCISIKSKGVSSDDELKGLVRKRKADASQIRSSDPLPMPKAIKKKKKSTSFSSDNVLTDLDEHLSGGKSSREEAALARSAPTLAFSGGYLPENETENMEVENPTISSKGDVVAQGEAKVVTFSGTILDSSLGPDCFLDDKEDQVSSLPPSWFRPKLMSFFRYADVFADDMEIDLATADDKFIPQWGIRNKDSVMNDLTARIFLFNISTPLDHARNKKMKIQDLGAAVLLNQAQSNVYVTELYRRWVEAESVKEEPEKETLALKRKIQRTPDIEKKLTQLSQDLQAQKERVKSLTSQNQSSQAAASSASEE
ncbi:hypothetical protein HanOQP8_Chr01g0022871 [Helianthus annuus]|nr:hypothetical protein HanOQP8_Chr01g0022871 [Helianthus annuus]